MLNKPKRVLTMGDQHGSLRAVTQVLDRCKFNPKEDLLINLGDIVDRWPESAQLVQFWIDLKADVIFIRGNHDAWCEEFLTFGNYPPVAYNQGGKETLASYVTSGVDRDEHARFFKRQENYYVDDQNRGFVHAGYTTKRGLGHEPYHTNYYWDRNLWETALIQKGIDPEGYQSAKLKAHTEIFIGHTSTIFWKYKKGWFEGGEGPITTPMNACNVWNLDTGAGYQGKLTVMDIDTKEYWQSDLVHELYSDFSDDLSKYEKE